MSWFLAFAGFAALVVLHEAGHFVAAKAVGMKVERFFLFFPPKLVSITRGETEYGIGMIPLGGFVKITGMNPEEEVPPEDAHRTYYASPVWKRIVVIAAGPLVNIIIAFVILFALELSVSEEPSNGVDTVAEDGAAAQVLQPGDTIVAVDGVSGGFEELREQIATHECEGGSETDACESATPAVLTIDRNGEEITREVTPTYSEDADRPLLGYVPALQSIDVSPGDAVVASADDMWRITTGTVGVLVRIFEAEQREQISSVVGSYEVTRQAIEFSAAQAFFLLAVISLSLAIINLFPFLPLDGGHIFWSLVEKVRGRPVSFSVMERASVVGILLVVMLFAIGLTNDIGRLTGEGFDIR
ncbi:MAG: site-2 protease family protein [Solirubrobacterales bacterium]